jgi:hypothetical protein
MQLALCQNTAQGALPVVWREVDASDPFPWKVMGVESHGWRQCDFLRWHPVSCLSLEQCVRFLSMMRGGHQDLCADAVKLFKHLKYLKLATCHGGWNTLRDFVEPFTTVDKITHLQLEISIIEHNDPLCTIQGSQIHHLTLTSSGFGSITVEDLKTAIVLWPKLKTLVLDHSVDLGIFATPCAGNEC